jgi:hypothetical protein
MKTDQPILHARIGACPLISRVIRNVLGLCVVATLTSTLHAQGTLTLSNIWNIPVNAVYDMGAANNERGVAINPVTGDVIYASRTSSNHLTVVNGETGAYINTMSNTDDFGALVITGGTLTLTHVGVADDGAIYACNLTASSSALKIYRWSDENANPTVAFGPANPGATVARFGDSFDVRGAGTDTQIIISGNGAPVVALFTTADGTTFSATELALGAGISAGDFGKGLAFGTNNTIYGKNSSSTAVRHASFDAVSGTTTLIETITADSLGVAVANDVTNKLLAVVVSDNNATQASHRLKVYDIANPASPVLRGDVLFPTPNAANANRIGAVDIQLDKIVGLDPNNGIVALKKVFVANLPPTITSQPLSQNALQGGYVSFAVESLGTEPLSYQWRLNETNLLAAATNRVLALNNLQLSDAGNYSVVVTNAGGSQTSSNATLEVLPSVLSTTMAPLWSRAPNAASFFLTADNTQRGLAFNAPSNHVLVVSRSPSNAVHVLDANTGAYLHALDMTGVSGGLFAVNVLGVADDGAVFVANLTTTGTDFKLYRWENDAPTTVASVVYDAAIFGNLFGSRIGDTIDVRGAGAGTEVILSANLSSSVAIFTTTDGVNYTSTVMDVVGAPSNAGGGFARLGVAFGKANSFWGKSSVLELTRVGYDLTTLSNGFVTYFPSTTATFTNITAIGYDTQNQLMAGLDYNETPDNVQLFDAINSATDPVLIDQDFFAADNQNLNGTGAIDFDVKGGRIFALDSNNGIVALKYAGRLTLQQTTGGQVLSWPVAAAVLQSSTNVAGPYANVTGATSPFTNTVGGTQFFRLQR